MHVVRVRVLMQRVSEKFVFSRDLEARLVVVRLFSAERFV